MKVRGQSDKKIHTERIIPTKSKVVVADFETSWTSESPDKPQSTWVWAWGCCSISTENGNEVSLGNSMSSFIQYLVDNKSIKTVYFHNLKFDGSFIVDYLHKNGWFETEGKGSPKLYNHFSIVHQGTDTVVIYLRPEAGRLIQILNSVKIIPLPLDDIGREFGFSVLKGELDYDTYRSEGEYASTEVSEDDVCKYIINDVLILARALNLFEVAGLLESKTHSRLMTIGSIAMTFWKDLNPEWKDTWPADSGQFCPWTDPKKFNEKTRQFEQMSIYDYCRSAYKAGLMWQNKQKMGKLLKNGIEADVNSFFPAMLKYFPMPYGAAKAVNYWDVAGKYQEDYLGQLDENGYYVDEDGNKYAIVAECKLDTFDAKDLSVLTVRDGGNNSEFCGSWGALYGSHLTGSLIALSGQDIVMMKENYYDVEIKLKSCLLWPVKEHMFDNFVDLWYNIKVQAKQKSNPGLAWIAKLILNNLIGKFGTRPENVKYESGCSDEEAFFNGSSDVIFFPQRQHEWEKTHSYSFIAIPIIVNALSRLILTRCMMKFSDRICYTAVDSMYIENISWQEFKEILSDGLSDDQLKPWQKLSDTELGAWKWSVFDEAKFLQRNCYALKSGDKTTLKWSGVRKKYLKNISFEDFKPGLKVKTLKPKYVRGGIILTESTQQIR